MFTSKEKAAAAATDKALDADLAEVLGAQDDVDAAAAVLAKETAELDVLEAALVAEDAAVVRPDKLPTAPYPMNAPITYTTANLSKKAGKDGPTDEYVEEQSTLEAFDVATNIGTFVLPSTNGKPRRISAEYNEDGVPGTWRLSEYEWRRQVVPSNPADVAVSLEGQQD